ncbi:MAG: hypothetical protein ACE5Z5_00260 [Candidatus Bathyarchaeia archaeon]
MRRGVVAFGAIVTLMAFIMMVALIHTNPHTLTPVTLHPPGREYPVQVRSVSIRTRGGLVLTFTHGAGGLVALMVGLPLMAVGLVVTAVGLLMAGEHASPWVKGAASSVFERLAQIMTIGLSHIARFAVLLPNLFKLAFLTAFLATLADYFITLYAFLERPWAPVLEANPIVLFLSSHMPAPIALTVTSLLGMLHLLSLFFLMRRKLKESLYSGTVLSFLKRLRSTATLWDLLFLVIFGTYIGATILHLSAFVSWWGLITSDRAFWR